MAPRKKRRPRETRARGAALAAALQALVLLRSGRWTAPALAAELGLNRRTIYRLLHALEAAGVQLECHVEGVERHYRIRRDHLRRLLRI